MQHAVYAQKHLIKVPGIARLRPAASKPVGELRTELAAPAPDALVRDGDAPLRQDQLHVPQAQAEHMIELDRVADDLRREAVSRIGART